MSPLKVRYWHLPMKLYGVRFRVMATKSYKGEMLYLAYSGRGDQALKWYAKRWNAENLHAVLKSRGFKLEASGLYHPQRVAVLLTCVTLAFVWCCLTGERAERQKPSQTLKYGYPAKSLFRRGLDLLQEDFLQRSRIPDPGGLHVFEVLH
ncbi:hypothetical protein DC3_57550 [Deinococcus cellulosilyticus NBRC 106333 = KACC 11606]|uniref:Transposase IS4-like domain-containing protein n=2 Tax=Deinococcus cellulosilyticus TaxID=401558 RepID=A0A511NBB7_DEIC1|nr:hypothetical protein DC3_57550 [Deinococcus cellulosilyticus NBRC 106333 = KACC 11606]